MPTLEQFLGRLCGLSPATATRFTQQWPADHQAFGERDLSGSDYVYAWADGIPCAYVCQETKSCALVLMCMPADGTEELIAVNSAIANQPTPEKGFTARIDALAEEERLIATHRGHLITLAGEQTPHTTAAQRRDVTPAAEERHRQRPALHLRPIHPARISLDRTVRRLRPAPSRLKVRRPPGRTRRHRLDPGPVTALLESLAV